VSALPASFDRDDDEPLNRYLVRLAAPHGNAIGRRRLLRVGISSTTIVRAVERGLLWPVHRGVYSVGRPDLSPYGRAWAAIHATRGNRPDARPRAVAGWSAAALLGLGAHPSRVVVVTVGHVRVPGIDARRVQALPSEAVVLDPQRLPVLGLPALVADLAPRASLGRIEDLLARADAHRGLVLDPGAIAKAVRNVTGADRVRRALEPYEDAPAGEYRSLVERLAARLVDRLGAGLVEVNGGVTLPDGRDIEVDILLRDLRVAIEIDGRDAHQRTRQFAADRARDRGLQRLGYRVLRFVYWDVRRTPHIVVADVLALLRAAA